MKRKSHFFVFLAAVSALALVAVEASQQTVQPPAERSKKDPAGGASRAEDAATALEKLPLFYRHWLDTVELLVTDEERDYFLSLTEDFRREAFMEKFWEVRDPEPRTGYNELKRRWDSRVDQVLATFGSLKDPRARVLLLNGPPGRFVLPNGRVVSRCYRPKEHVELWFYGGSERTNETFILIFFRRLFSPDGSYEIWRPDRPLEADHRRRLPTTNPGDFCDGDLIAGAINQISRDFASYHQLLQRILSPPRPASREWVSTFAAMATDLPAGAALLESAPQLEFVFPGRNQSRTAVQGLVSLPAENAGILEAPGGQLYGFLLTGEVIRNDRLFENFRYRFDLPVGESGRDIPLVFQRYVRPGEVEVRLKIEDLHAGRFAHLRRRFEVPRPEGLDSTRRAPELAFFGLLNEANEAAERGQQIIRLVPPEEGQIKLGMVRFTTVGAGSFDKVTFFLNDLPILTKNRPPFSVELNLGRTASAQRLRVVAVDEVGEEVASDEILLNQGGQRFRVRITEPRSDQTYERSLSAVVQVDVPDGEELERVELFMKEQRVATLYQPPFIQPMLLENDALTYVRAVGYLEDGNTSEDVVFVNAPDYFEKVDVQYVELYASVFGRNGRPLLDLEKENFTVSEDGVEQEVSRFDYVRDLPIHAGLLLDSSASMQESLGQVTQAALSFVRRTIQQKDRVTLISFNVRPKVETRFTNDVREVEAALAGLRPLGGTALYDSLIFALNYFDGIKGQKALLLLSDGKDESSQFDFDSALRMAYRAGVTIYVVGLKEAGREREARKTLERIAQETGGRAFFIEDLDELSAIYGSIQDELRSQYLIAYQSTSTKDPAEFRTISVKTDRRGTEVRTLSGYYP